MLWRAWGRKTGAQFVERSLEMSTTQAALHRKETPTPGDLYLSLELSDKSWKLTFGDGGGVVSRHTVAAGDQTR